MQTTNSQYHLPAIGKKLADKAKREGGADPFPAPSVRKTLEVAVSRLAHYAQFLGEGELYIPRSAKAPEVQTCARLQSVPGLGQSLALVIR